MNNWKTISLAEYFDFSSGLSKGADQFGTGYPFLSFKEVFKNYFVPKSLVSLVNTTEKEREKCSINEGDIFLTRTSETNDELGMSCIALKDYPNATFNGFTKRLRPKIRGIVDPVFIGFYLRSSQFRAQISAYSNLSTRASLNNDILERLKLKVPPIGEQRKIGRILMNYTRLIENNNQRIQLLEEMAAEIYKEWFVRFRFPGYESASFVDKEGKEVPQGTDGALPLGWEKVKLKDICIFKMGQSPKSEFYNDTQDGLPFHQGVTNFNDRFPTHSKYCTDLKRIATIGDVLLSVRAPVGRINIANRKLIIGRGLCSVIHKGNFQNYLFYLLKDVFKHEDSFGNGAVFNAVSRNDLERIPITQPSLSVSEKYQVLVKPIDDEIQVLTDKNETLKQTRDLLLPRLISGKLSVENLALSREEENLVNS